MDRLLFEKGELNKFLNEVILKLSISNEQAAALIGVSGRTLRDWKREKFNPSKNHVFKLSKISEVMIPKYKVLPPYWNAKNSARLGGKRTYELYGLLGTYKSRSRGGVMSWYKRKHDPDLLKKYTNTFKKPRRSKNLAEFLGIMLGDGGLTKTQCVIYLNRKTEKEYTNYVAALIKELFDLTPSVHESEKKGVVMVSISGINLVKYLTRIGLCLGNKVFMQAGVPNWVFSNSEYIKACIRGLVDTDGCLSIHRYQINKKTYSYPKLIFVNRSEPILEFVYRGLLELGFSPKRTANYQVWLHKHKEVRNYLENIGTHNDKPVFKEILGGVA